MCMRYLTVRQIRSLSLGTVVAPVVRDERGAAMRQLSLPSLQKYREVAPFVIRGVMGVVFAYHGWQKFDRGLDGFNGFVDSLGVPLPEIVGPAVALLELVGGCMLVVGL